MVITSQVSSYVRWAVWAVAILSTALISGAPSPPIQDYSRGIFESPIMGLHFVPPELATPKWLLYHQASIFVQVLGLQPKGL